MHEELGWNFRITNLQAALGLAQLEQLEEHLARKRHIGRRYSELLSDVPNLTLPPPHTPCAENLYWVFGVVLEDTVPFDAADAMQRLTERGIGTRPFFWPMHEQPVLQRLGYFDGVSCPVAERLARRGFYVPSSATLTDPQIERVVHAVRELLS